MNALRTLAALAAALVLAAVAPGRASAQEADPEELLQAVSEMLLVFDVDPEGLDAVYDPAQMTITCGLTDDGETMGCDVGYPTADATLCRGAAVVAHVGAPQGMIENELDANLRVTTTCGAFTVEIVEDIAGIRVRQTGSSSRVIYEKMVSFEQG